eukprot:scaffold11341_cov28-Tisochrysis_lutea.AAC.2
MSAMLIEHKNVTVLNFLLPWSIAKLCGVAHGNIVLHPNGRQAPILFECGWPDHLLDICATPGPAAQPTREHSTVGPPKWWGARWPHRSRKGGVRDGLGIRVDPHATAVGWYLRGGDGGAGFDGRLQCQCRVSRNLPTNTTRRPSQGGHLTRRRMPAPVDKSSRGCDLAIAETAQPHLAEIIEVGEVANSPWPPSTRDGRILNPNALRLDGPSATVTSWSCFAAIATAIIMQWLNEVVVLFNRSSRDAQARNKSYSWCGGSCRSTGSARLVRFKSNLYNRIVQDGMNACQGGKSTWQIFEGYFRR